MIYALVALVALLVGVGLGVWLAVNWKGSEVARVVPLAAQALEAKQNFDTALREAERVHTDLQMRKWGGNGVVRGSGIIT